MRPSSASRCRARSRPTSTRSWRSVPEITVSVPTVRERTVFWPASLYELDGHRSLARCHGQCTSVGRRGGCRRWCWAKAVSRICDAASNPSTRQGRSGSSYYRTRSARSTAIRMAVSSHIRPGSSCAARRCLMPDGSRGHPCSRAVWSLDRGLSWRKGDGWTAGGRHSRPPRLCSEAGYHPRMRGG